MKYIYNIKVKNQEFTSKECRDKMQISILS